MSSAAPFAGPVTPPAHQRATLEEWKAKLGSLIERRRQCLRQTNRQLCVHLASAIDGAHQVIAETCAPQRSALICEAAAAVEPYFGRLGDARQAAANFPAVLAFNSMLRGDPAGDDLDTLTAKAEQTVALLVRIIEGRELWRFEPGNS